MKTHWLLSLTVVTLLFACSKSDELPDPTPEPSKEEVDLTTLKVGQRSLFVRYTTTCENLEADFAFTGDTLIWEVVSTIEGDLQLKESFTERSPLYLNGAQEPVIYPVTGDGKKVLLPQRELSNLFFFYANDTIFLQPAASVPLQQDACRLMLQSEPFIGNDIGVVPTFELGPLRQEDQLAVSCVPPIFDVEAYLVYDEHRLRMSHVITNGCCTAPSTVNGWVRLDK